MSKKQFRGVITFDFNVDQENYKMFSEIESQLEAHMALFAEQLAKGEMDSELELSKHVTVENPQSLFRDRRGPTGPIEQIVFRGGRGENDRLSKAQIERFKKLESKINEGLSLSSDELDKYKSLRLRAKSTTRGEACDG